MNSRVGFQLIYFFCFIYVEVLAKIQSLKSENSLISKAFSEVVYEIYVKNQIDFSVIITEDLYRENYELYDEILAQIALKSSFQIITLDANINFRVTISMIIFLPGCMDYRMIHFRSFFNNISPKDFKFLIFVYQCSLNFIKNTLSELIYLNKVTFDQGTIELFEFILINDHNFLHLATIEWFTETSCNQGQLKVLNSFNKLTAIWNSNFDNYEKFQNFYGCELKFCIVSLENGALYSLINLNENGDEVASGLIPAVYRMISKINNYKISFQRNFENADVMSNIVRLESFLNFTTFHMTSTFIELRDIIIATPGELYSPYEKLLLPFDQITWNLLNFTFLAAFVAIFVINRLPKFVQNQVFGENVQNPSLNVISTFFGLAQVKVPKTSCPRFLLILFVFFCLIFRTCYQSKLFEFMTSESRHSPPKTIEDLRDRNYTLYLTDEINRTLNEISNELWRW